MKRLLVRSIQGILDVEMNDALGARASTRRARRPGYFVQPLSTRLGVVELRVARPRDGQAASAVFERYLDCEARFLTALGRMCVRGTATPRDVRALAEDLCGHALSDDAVETLTSHINAELAQFLSRQLEKEHLSLSAHLRMRSGLLHFADA